ncbi:MAG TPA: hypothetical protein GXX30_00930 [Firmicutes bacterium]|uniref:ABC transporter permease n=1 Tax=Candidatus Fermentithermobacillus carboniphilus TaxID=3085328 RepID=A0AAT9LBX3_9FIRM|nr:MAG: hypothetical protein IMF26_00265 [Candidatus Fermentithermobacillus carboniphilus]HHW17456.1 hypothetical protein [Candidatus Fermentithermobacillaceae bacterium]
MSIWQRLLNIDRRIVYLFLFAFISLPLLVPIGLPLTISPETRAIYDYIEKLPEGSVVVVSFDYSPSSYSEQHPQAVAVMNHLMRKPGIKIILVAFWEQGPIMAEEILRTIDTHGKEYGKDFVHLGYVAGGETAMSAFAADIHKTFPVDYRKNPIDSLPMMADIRSAKDISLLISIAAGSPGVPEFARQIQGPYKVPFAAGLVAISVPITMPYMQSGQMFGLMAGLRGAAEYEQLLNMKGKGSIGMDAISFSHIVVLAFILIANVAYLANRKGGAK